MIKLKVTLFGVLTAVSLGLVAPYASAEMMVVLVEEASMSYELGPAKYDNSPSKYDNSISKYDNSPSKYDNSPSKYDNSSGKNRLFNQQRDVVGYAVYSSDGVLNIFSVSGIRLGYVPAGNHTQSIFASENTIWCGSLGMLNGKLVVGLTKSCYYRLLSDQ